MRVNWGDWQNGEKLKTWMSKRLQYDEEAALWTRAVKQRKRQPGQSESACSQFFTAGFKKEVFLIVPERGRVSVFTCKLRPSALVIVCRAILLR